MAGYIDPEVPWEILKEANRKHDAEYHLITMWQRAKYRGEFGYPPDPKPKRKRMIRVIDARGNATTELR